MILGSLAFRFRCLKGYEEEEEKRREELTEQLKDIARKPSSCSNSSSNNSCSSSNSSSSSHGNGDLLLSPVECNYTCLYTPLGCALLVGVLKCYALSDILLYFAVSASLSLRLCLPPLLLLFVSLCSAASLVSPLHISVSFSVSPCYSCFAAFCCFQLLLLLQLAAV